MRTTKTVTRETEVEVFICDVCRRELEDVRWGECFCCGREICEDCAADIDDDKDFDYDDIDCLFVCKTCAEVRERYRSRIEKVKVRIDKLREEWREAARDKVMEGS